MLESNRRARFDGVIRYGDELIVVIESKLHEGVDPRQAQEIPLGALSGHCRLEKAILVRWQALTAAWQDLSERGLLSYSEQSLLDDFFEMAHESYDYLLPFKTLARAEGSEERVRQRVKHLIEDATGKEASPEWGGWKVIGSWSKFERFWLGVQHDQARLVLTAWPGERKREALNLYGDPLLAQSVAALNDTAIGHAHREVYPLLSVTNRVPKARQAFDNAPDLGKYIEFWPNHTDNIWRRSANDLKPLFDWLVDHGLSVPSLIMCPPG